ncbi:MAG: DUF1028 domain-containing protein [Hyphomicrobiaceae bacterium]
MTWSIIARDEATGRMGAIVATRFFAVGARTPYVETGIGAIASQALFNPYYGPRGMALLAAGATAEDTVRILTNADEGRGHRQLHVMDRQGRCAAYTGAACVVWCGHRIGPAHSVAGNMLTGPEVVAATAKVYEEAVKTPFARRLIAAMVAGEAAGGDKRGRQSAALVVHDGEDYSLLDLRVDDHADPLAELARLESAARERWVHFRRALPSRADPAGVTDRAKIEDMIQASIAEGYE